MTIDPNKTYTATIDTTAGEIKLKPTLGREPAGWVSSLRDGSTGSSSTA
jgi:hypothetical protein